MISLALVFLYLASHTDSTIILIASAVGFALANNTIFALLHESVHSVFHQKRSINNFFGHLLSAFFPTSFNVQKVCHLGHHLRNRTDAEFFDAYTDDDNKTFKTISLYAVLTGVYWAYAPLAIIWLIISPKTLLNSVFNGDKDNGVGHLGGEGMIGSFKYMSNKEINSLRLEAIISWSIQISLFYILDLSVLGWVICYWAFALKWGSIQYADHAYSPRDVKNGAWNLKVPVWLEKVFLNYHYHLVHHQHPHIPWLYLPKFEDKTIPKISHWEIYKKMWRGPIKVDSLSKVILPDNELKDLIYLEPFTKA